MRFIFSNWQAKIGSLLLAIALYINLQTSKLTSKTYEIPIEYPELSQNLYYDARKKKTYKVRLEGFKDLISFHARLLRIIIDPDDLNAGKNLIEVKKIEGLPPKGIKVVPLEGKIPIHVDTLESKTIRIEVFFEDELPPTYVRVGYSVTPKTMVISGPKKIVEKWNRYTPKISLKDKRESFSRKIRIRLPGSLSLVSKKRDILVRVNIKREKPDGPEPGEQVVVGIPVSCRNVASTLIAKPAKKSISVKFYSPTTLNSIQIIRGLKVSMNCNHRLDSKTQKIKPDKIGYHTVEVEKKPELADIDIIYTTPDRIKVAYQIKQVKPKNELEPIEPETSDPDEPLPPDLPPE